MQDGNERIKAKFIHDNGDRVVYIVDIPDEEVEEFLKNFKADIGPGFINNK